MKKFTGLFMASMLIGSYTFAQNMTIKTLPYPQTKKVDTVDTYFGTQVPDPYRWLENDQAADTKAWVKEEKQGYPGLPGANPIPRCDT